MRCPAAVCAALVLSCAPLASAGEIVKLTVTEPAGVERVREPVTTGVPFPKGLVRDAGKLALLGPDGKPVPAAFTAIDLWPGDKSVRWALVDTQVSLGAKESKTFAVVEGEPAAPGRWKIAVDDGADRITVNAGRVRFAVRKKGFRLFESLDHGAARSRLPDRLLLPHPEGLAMTVAGVRYTSAADVEGKVVIEEQNPMRVCLLATGRLAPVEGRGGDRYDYEVRIHACAWLPVVKLAVTVVKKYGKRRVSTHSFEDLSLHLRLDAAGALHYALGGEGAPATGKLAAGAKAGVLVKSSTRWELTGAAEGAGDPKATKPLTLGWADLAGARGGVAAGVYRFWETGPKGIEVSGDGTMNIGLYPKACGARGPFFTGMARTHHGLLVFHERGEKPAELQKRFAAFQRPLYALAPPEWYCRTNTFGPLAPAGAKLAGEGTKAFAELDGKLSGWFDALRGQRRDRWTKRGVTMDAYGWLAYGDTLHWVWNVEPKDSPWAIAWDANYYDLPHVAALQFARTGGRKYLEYHLDHAWHVMDVDTIHWDPGFPKGGCSRRCPATNHVGFDPPHQREPVLNAAFDHHKSESVFERYYLTGDRRARKVALDLLGHAFRHRDGNYAGTGERRPGHQIVTLVAGYWHTGEKKYLERARKVIDAGIRRQDEHGGLFNDSAQFTTGIALEAFGKYYLATGEKDVLACVVRACDQLIARGHRRSNCAFAHALVWRETGEEKYLTEALACLLSGRPGHLSKDMGHMYRSAPNASGLLVERAD